MSPEEFEQLYTNNLERLYRYVFSYIPNTQDCEDICSQIFEAIWTKHKTLDTNRIYGYIKGITRNKINTHLRKKYKVFYKLTNFDENIFHNDKNKRSNNNDNKPIWSKHLEYIITQLTNTEKSLYQLRYKQNLTYKKIAKELGISVSNVKVRNHRLTKKMQKIWKTRSFHNS